MTNNVINTPGTVGAGDIQFFDSIQPPLKTEKYTVTATQTVKNVISAGAGNTPENDPVYKATKSLNINGPRFQIQPNLIHSIFPPANQRGNYANYLPNMVFTDFSLPWSRAINPVDTKQYENVPWLSLLTIHQEEFEGNTPLVPEPKTVTTKQLVSPGDGILAPNLETDFKGDDDTKVKVIDINLAFFQAIAPKLDELPFLSHSRAVNTDGKVVLNMDADGCFSLCMGNRMPAVGKKNQILLVSLEGHQDHLNGSTLSGDYDTIRLVQLGGWEFNTTDFAKEFLNMMEALCDADNGGVSLIQLEANKLTEENDVAKEALEIGYVALKNDMRVGENATSWYRSPLTPAPTKRSANLSTDDGNYGPYIYSDHAMHYDPETGIFNHAYSAAWQIGRLLALSDASFAQGIFNWRSEYLRSIVFEARQTQTREAAASLVAASSGTRATDGSVDLQSAARSFFSDTFQGVQWDTMTTRQQKMLGEHLPGVLSEQEVLKAQEDDEDPLLTLHRKIK